MIFDHDSYEYICRRNKIGMAKHNGAYYYSKEIVDNIIPLVNTDYNWVTVTATGRCWDHSIVFIHDNQRLEIYQWLSHYKDLVLVCGVPETCEKVSTWGTPIYLPLSVDVEYVQQFKTEKTEEDAFVGRLTKRTPGVPEDTPSVGGVPREEMLREMAKYKRVYAVGRCAIEAKVLGCEVLPYDTRYPDPRRWRVVDNKIAARVLQKELDRLKERRKK